MANSLLDFVMALVRDPDAAAQYAANPAQAIADANLSDVTSVDVNHLIPVVAESMSTVVPTGGGSGDVGTLLDSAHNVWSSGAATAAFDAFDDHLPLQGSDIVADHVPTVANVIELPEDSTPTIVDHGFDDVSLPTIAGPTDQGPAFDAPVVDDGQTLDAATLDDAHHDVGAAIDDHLDHPHDPGFDIFT
ncbi:Rv0340 family IniB-related protein [Mycolicibacterium sp.]|uniref:Rv0340 family IniB-related protein n=1 Tax=Mycolicibacterium sp. TaxID=2320850 RepID=UPI001A1A3C33|nr:Rv0340 family IniB-related protein [Mycolicibacterium sp.]MBJ7340199.1 Rv0340 family protein [Mycolicibacterium sp.]